MPRDDETCFALLPSRRRLAWMVRGGSRPDLDNGCGDALDLVELGQAGIGARIASGVAVGHFHGERSMDGDLDAIRWIMPLARHGAVILGW